MLDVLRTCGKLADMWTGLMTPPSEQEQVRRRVAALGGEVSRFQAAARHRGHVDVGAYLSGRHDAILGKSSIAGCVPEDPPATTGLSYLAGYVDFLAERDGGASRVPAVVRTKYPEFEHLIGTSDIIAEEGAR